MKDKIVTWYILKRKMNVMEAYKFIRRVYWKQPKDRDLSYLYNH